MIRRNALITATKSAEFLAKRQVNVHANPLLFIALLETTHKHPFPVFAVNRLIPKRYRRITRVARNRYVVLVQ